MLVYSIPFYIGHHDLFFINGTFCNNFAIRAAYKALPPKFDAVAARRRFMANAICRGDVATVCNGETALNCFPGGMLRQTELLLFRWMQADCCRITNDLSAAQRRQPCRFRVPLVQAHADANFDVRRLPRLNSDGAGPE